MFDFPLWKKLSILVICLIGLIFSIPNFIAEENKLPQIFQNNRINPGLDLQGGRITQ